MQLKKSYRLLILCILVIAVSSLDFLNLYENFESMTTYIIKPLFWIFIFIYTLVFYKDEYIRNTKYQKDILFYTIVATIIYFIFYFFVGYVDNFANNPYNRTLTGFLINLWTFGVVIVAKEYIRYYLINNCNKKYIYLYGFLISFMFAFSEISKVNFLNNFANVNIFIKFFISGIMCETFISLFLTYIAYFASYKATLVYRLLPLILTLILPILPNINWMLLGLVKSIVPFFTYMYINSLILKIDNKQEDRKEYKSGFKFWAVSCVFLAIMIMFGLEKMTYYPVVIATASMEPNILVGDIVIIKKTDPDNIKVNDVIEYQVENYGVIHRVVEIKDDGSFITKGDNNNTIDMFAVTHDQVKGIVKARIPYLGYPTLFVNNLRGKNLEDEVIVDTGK